MILTAENYYSAEANMSYMSSTQYKAFRSCEAAALAEIRGEYVRPVTSALLIGSYVDAHFEGTLDGFKAEHPEIFKRDGTLNAEFSKADQIIARCEADDLFMHLMSGKKQVIYTGTISGVPYKIKIDSLLDAAQTMELAAKYPETAEWLGMQDGLIVDGKVMRDMKSVWRDGEFMPFVTAWGYDVQGAIYQDVQGGMLPFALAVATKEDEPDIEALILPDDTLEAALDEVEVLSPRYRDIKLGKIEPTRCEHCAYCRSTKKLTGFKRYWEVDIID